jgi:hypothetical protein
VLEMQERMHDVEVREHRALRPAGGAGGVEDDRRILLGHRGDRRSAPRIRLCVQQQARTAVGDDVLDLRLRQPHADGNRDRAQMQDAEKRRGEVDAVADAHRHAIALRHALPRQRAGDAGRALGELGIGEPHLAADQRFGLRPRRGGSLERRVDARRALRVAAHDAIAEVALLADHSETMACARTTSSFCCSRFSRPRR